MSPGGVIWIALVAGLLAGVVAMNVAVLRLNMKLDHLGRERADLRAENAALSVQLSSAGLGTAHPGARGEAARARAGDAGPDVLRQAPALGARAGREPPRQPADPASSLPP